MSELSLLDTAFVERYARDDWLVNLINGSRLYPNLLMDEWLVSSLPKRAMTDWCYAPLRGTSGRRVLDVGGGVGTVPLHFAGQHELTILDPLAHDRDLEDVLERCAAHVEVADWWDVPLRTGYDLIIANDLFPNVDQRLGPFLERVLPLGSEVRMTLTCHTATRFYRTRRLDADELLTLQVPGPSDVVRTLQRCDPSLSASSIDTRLLGDDLAPIPSLFANGRHVLMYRRHPSEQPPSEQPLQSRPREGSP